eukprot:403332579
MGNSISLNVLCCRRNHLLKLKFDTQRKDRPPSKTENLFDQLLTLSSRKEKQTRVKATRFKIKIPAQICRRRKDSHELPNVEIQSERIEYLQEMESNLLKVQNQQKINPNKSGYQSNINLSTNTSGSRTQFRTHEYYANKYGNNSKSDSPNPKFNKRVNLKSQERSFDKKFSQNQLSSEKQKIDQVTQDSQSQQSDNSVNKLSPLRIGKLDPYLDKSQDSFNNKLSSNIEDSIAFDSASQSVCTDLEALNQLADQLKPPTQSKSKNKKTKKISEPKINILINSLSSENLFSPDSKLQMTTSQDSQESHSNFPINRRTQRAQRKQESQREHAIQNYIEQQNFSRKIFQEKLKQFASMTQAQKEKSILKVNKIYRHKLISLPFDHNQKIKILQQEHQMKKIFTNETVQIRKVCQSIQDLTFTNKTFQEREKTIEILDNLHQILLKSTLLGFQVLQDIRIDLQMHFADNYISQSSIKLFARFKKAMRNDLDFSLFINTHQIMIGLSQKVLTLKDKNIVENSLLIIKYQNLVGNILKCLSSNKQLKPCHDISDLQQSLIITTVYSQIYLVKELITLTTSQQSILSMLEQAACIFILSLQTQTQLSQEIFSQDYLILKKMYTRISDESSEQDLGLVFETLMSLGNPDFIKKHVSNERLNEIISKSLYSQDAVLFLAIVMMNDLERVIGLDQNTKDAVMSYLNQSLLHFEDFNSPIMIEDSVLNYNELGFQNPHHMQSPQHDRHSHSRARIFQNELKLDHNCLILDTQRSHQPFEYQVIPPLSTRSMYSQRSFNSSSQQSQATQNYQQVRELNIKDLLSLNVVQELIQNIKKGDFNIASNGTQSSNNINNLINQVKIVNKQ